MSLSSGIVSAKWSKYLSPGLKSPVSSPRREWQVAQSVMLWVDQAPSMRFASAKGLPTKVWWDWSKAGQDRPEAKDKYGLDTYVKIKGEFKWEKDIRPTYLWYNGETMRYLLGDTIDPSVSLPIDAAA